ncbi:MAG TPA: SDR family oxidoreductase [Bdellovibrionota bacterium]|nr:SDR family oxidoreductase [Bdellovibrionota bacterium]
MKEIFITGFPGFIAKHLVLELAKNPSYRITLLVHKSMYDKAQVLFTKHSWNNKHKLLVGDITQENLGLDTTKAREVREQTNIVFHLAAIYDLTVKETVAKHVNVFGTKNTLDFFSTSPALEHFNYISTCYVSGTRTGLIFAHELEKGKNFFNFYESTKHEAERIVQEYKTRLPITTFRPSIVVGHSQTGETEKFDGPYIVLKFLHRIRWLLRLVPNLGFKHCEVNTIPVDYLISVLVDLGFNTAARGKTYQVCDPHPPTTEEFFGEMVKMIGGVTPYKCSFLRSLILKLLRVPGVSKITGMTCQTLDYFSHPGCYREGELKKDLAHKQIKSPGYQTYYPILYRYMRENL